MYFFKSLLAFFAEDGWEEEKLQRQRGATNMIPWMRPGFLAVLLRLPMQLLMRLWLGVLLRKSMVTYLIEQEHNNKRIVGEGVMGDK